MEKKPEKMTEREIAMLIEEKAKAMAKAVYRDGKDVEIVGTSTGCSIKLVSKEKLA